MCEDMQSHLTLPRACRKKITETKRKKKGETSARGELKRPKGGCE